MRVNPLVLGRVVFSVGRRLAGLRRRTVTVCGFRMVYLEGGAGPPLVLLHGAGADKDNFLLVARRLRRHYRLVVPDLPGFGESDRHDAASYRVADQVARLSAFVAALGIGPFHLGGNSMGGLIAGAYAVAHPNQVESLWLLAPAGVRAAEPSELMQAIEQGRDLPIFARNVAEVRRLIQFVIHRPRYMPGFLLAYLAAHQRRHYALNQRIVAELTEGPWLDELLAVPVDTPTLIVWGDQDRALHVSGAGILGGLMPKASVIVLEGIGHVPMIEAPRRSAADYRAFRAALSTHPWEIVVSDDVLRPAAP